MSKVKRIPKRSQVKASDCWNLASLFPSDEAWETAFLEWEKEISGYEKFRGKLAEGAATIAKCLKFDSKFDRAGERLGVYAYLKTTEDMANSIYQRMLGRYRNAASRAGQASAYIRPELLAVPAETMQKYLGDKTLAPYRLLLERMIRYRAHTLSDSEERLMAMQSEMSQASNQIFRQLHDSDMKFGTVKNERGEIVDLTNSSFTRLLNSPDRKVRKNAFHQYYAQYAGHENSLGATLNASIQRDIYYARARNYKTSLEAALFPDQVPESVYTNLVSAVHNRLPALHRFYDVRRRKMKLRDIHHYDCYVPILSDLEMKHSWNQAVATVVESLSPLGTDYCKVLEGGLSNGWCDRYENQGKQSGAFSYGTFDGDPYILMNYQTDVLNQVFTLAHEAGHSMHSYFSSKTQPFEYYGYSIFVAEVASTFNEMLLSHKLMSKAKNDRQRAYLINREIDDIRGTILRQTMFAEFELLTHTEAEAGEPLTIDKLKKIYRGLLDRYFGPEFAIDDELSLECLRIPHFYRAFYVYKYATGMSAAIALAKRVLEGGKSERDAYLNFLCSGCSKDPLDLLRDAGVDMESPEPVETALAHFEHLVDELDTLI